MQKDLELLRRFAVASRSRPNFGGSFLKLDEGNWLAGKKDANGRRLGADVPDAMGGYQKFKNKKPILAIVRIADGIAPPERDELDETDESLWSDRKDPWQPVSILPFWDPETHEIFIFSSSAQGGRDAVAYLIEAYADNCAGHPEDADKLPLVELCSDSYVNTHGRTIYKPLFEVRDWILRPTALRRLKPPPVTMLAIENKSAPAPTEASAAKRSTKSPKHKITSSKDDDMDDTIPF
jgi:hypothetical protein